MSGFENVTAAELPISKFMNAITDNKLRDQLLKEMNPEKKKTIAMMKQKTYKKKYKKNNNGGINIRPRRKKNIGATAIARRLRADDLFERAQE